MSKTKLALLLDSFSISIIISGLIFLWLRKFLKNAILVKFFSILIFLSCFILLFIILLKNNNKSILKNKTEKFLNNCLNYLIICNQSDYINYICKLLNCEYIENFFFKKSSKLFYINLKTTLTDSHFYYIQEFTCNKKPTETCIILYRKKDKTFDELFELSQKKYISLEYEILKKAMIQKNYFPINKDELVKSNFKTKIKNSIKTKASNISKKHFKELFFSGLSLLFLSLIIPFSNYYLVVGSILLIISIITLFKKNYHSKNDDDIDILIN